MIESWIQHVSKLFRSFKYLSPDSKRLNPPDPIESLATPRDSKMRWHPPDVEDSDLFSPPGCHISALKWPEFGQKTARKRPEIGHFCGQNVAKSGQFCPEWENY